MESPNSLDWSSVTSIETGRKELTAKQAASRIQQARKLADRCLNITLTTEHDVFFQFSAHVKELSYTIHENGYKTDDFCPRISVYLDDETKKVTDFFKAANAELDALLEL
ncbi:hypothetical protein INR79_24275 [Vibrio sp. SCSIO 43132]|uniref:hypothetical protein n=1 Tax=Vibrio sp. SCSIO 43132 TaxID=2779363 RepID=UPI001CA8AAEE|nr:hypothetical protein [Vibrio sp. SCSIO 43132]UAB72377.1 hypothetical protein INR79_24275 [Vibrio sp. SCSIO 43132]